MIQTDPPIYGLTQDNTTGKYKIILEVSAYGYKNSTGTEMFKVSPTSVTTTTGFGIANAAAIIATDATIAAIAKVVFL
jgi:hypothetical protein